LGSAIKCRSQATASCCGQKPGETPERQARPRGEPSRAAAEVSKAAQTMSKPEGDPSSVDQFAGSVNGIRHSPAETIAAWPTTVTTSRSPRPRNASLDHIHIKSVLFLSTGKYCRSCFGGELFNHRAEPDGHRDAAGLRSSRSGISISTLI
jgi:hypothetical protein